MLYMAVAASNNEDRWPKMSKCLRFSAVSDSLFFLVFVLFSRTKQLKYVRRRNPLSSVCEPSDRSWLKLACFLLLLRELRKPLFPVVLIFPLFPSSSSFIRYSSK